MNSYLTNDSSCHSTLNAVPKQNLSTIEGYIKKAMFIFKLQMFLRVQPSHEMQNTATSTINNLEAVQNDSNVQQIMTPDSTSILTSQFTQNQNKNCLDIAVITYAQRAITQQQNTMESNILNYEEDLENAYMLYSYIRFSHRSKNTAINQLAHNNQDTASQVFESDVEVKSQQAPFSIFQQINSIYQEKELAIDTCTKLMEALLNYRKNAIFYETYQDVVSRLTKDDCTNYQSELSTFFAQTARGIMLTKSAHKGSLMIKLMSEIGIQIHVENHLNPVIEGCFRSGKYHFVQEVLNYSKFQDSLSVSTLKILVKYYSKLNQTQLALNYFSQLQFNESFVKDSCYVTSVNQVLDSLLKTECFQDAEQLFNQTYMLSKDHVNCIDMMTFSCMIKAYCKIHKLNSALNVLTLMRERNIKPDEVLYNSLIDGCSKNNQLNKAFQIYDDMINDGVVPSTITFNTLIDCCVRSGHQDKAWEVLEQMKTKQVKSDNYTYSTLFKGIKGENQKQDLEKAFQLYKQLQESNDFTPDEILFNVLLDACINCKQLDRAVELFKQLKNQPTPTSSEQSKTENNQQQNESLDLDSPPCIKQDQQDNGSVPTISQFQPQQQSIIRPDEISFNTIIKGCAQEKKLSLAFEMFNLMKQQPNLKPNDVTYNSLIDACVRCGKMSSAWQLLNEMQSQHNIVPDNFTYSTLIKGIRAENQSQNGIISNPMDLEKAFALLEQMKHSSSPSSVKPDEILYNCLIDACVRFHDVNRAVAVFQEMQLSNIKPSSVTYGILIKAYGQANQLDNAFFVFRKMKESSLIPNAVTYGCLIDACVKNNQIDKAMEVFETMKRDGVQLNTIIFTTLIKGFAKSFKLDQALEVYQLMKIDDKIRPNNVTYNSLIDCCIRCNSIQKAMEIFNEMKQPQSLVKPDLITYSTMIKGFCREKNIQQALIILNDMEKQNIVADEVLYNSLLDGCCKANEIDMALKVYKNMEILKIKPSNVTYSILVKIYGKQRNLPKALGVLEEMKKDGIKPGLIVYTCLLQTCIKSRQLKTAESLFHDMRIQGLRGDVLTYQTMINGCLQFQKFDTMLLSLLKDASDTNVHLPHEITQNILTELNKWNTDDQKLKSDVTQSVLAYMDNQKLNNSCGGFSNNHYNQNHSQSFYNNQNPSFRNHNKNNNTNNNSNMMMSSQSFYQGNNNMSQSFIGESIENNTSKNEYKNHRKGFFNSSRQNIQQQSTLSQLQNKTQAVLGSQEQTTKQTTTSTTMMMMSVNDFTTPNQLSDLSAINHKQSNEKPNDEDEFVISSFNPSGTTTTHNATSNITQQKDVNINNHGFNNKSYQHHSHNSQQDKSYNSQKQGQSNHYNDRSYQNNSGYNKQNQQQYYYDQYDYESYENYDDYSNGNKQSQHYQSYQQDQKSRNYDQSYYKDNNNKSSQYYYNENSNNSSNYYHSNQHQQPNTQQVFGKHQKQHNKGESYKKQQNYNNNINNNQYYDKENYHPNKQTKTTNTSSSHSSNYHHNNNVKNSNSNNNNYHNQHPSYGYNQGYY